MWSVATFASYIQINNCIITYSQLYNARPHNRIILLPVSAPIDHIRTKSYTNAAIITNQIIISTRIILSNLDMRTNVEGDLLIKVYSYRLGLLLFYTINRSANIVISEKGLTITTCPEL